jgi:hypothetical protein
VRRTALADVRGSTLWRLLAAVAVVAVPLLLAAGVLATNWDNHLNRMLALSDGASARQAHAARERVAVGMTLSEAVAALAPGAWRRRVCNDGDRTRHGFYYGTHDEQLKAGVQVYAAGPPGQEVVTDVYMLLDEMNWSLDHCPELPLLS